MAPPEGLEVDVLGVFGAEGGRDILAESPTEGPQGVGVAAAAQLWGLGRVDHQFDHRARQPRPDAHGPNERVQLACPPLHRAEGAQREPHDVTGQLDGLSRSGSAPFVEALPDPLQKPRGGHPPTGR